MTAKMGIVADLEAAILHAGLSPTLGAPGQGYQIEQNASELAQFLSVCVQLGVTSMLELGTGEGGGLARFCYQRLNWSVTSIDHRAPLHESGRFILGETGDPDVYAQVTNQRFDLVFIDADHHYESVKRDNELYAALATKVVALHDIAPGREGTQGAARFWLERSRDWVEGGRRFGAVVTPPELRRGYWEFIDPVNPIGIGYYEVERA